MKFENFAFLHLWSNTINIFGGNLYLKLISYIVCHPQSQILDIKTRNLPVETRDPPLG